MPDFSSLCVFFCFVLFFWLLYVSFAKLTLVTQSLKFEAHLWSQLVWSRFFSPSQISCPSSWLQLSLHAGCYQVKFPSQSCVLNSRPAYTVVNWTSLLECLPVITNSPHPKLHSHSSSHICSINGATDHPLAQMWNRNQPWLPVTHYSTSNRSPNPLVLSS